MRNLTLTDALHARAHRIFFELQCQVQGFNFGGGGPVTESAATLVWKAAERMFAGIDEISAEFAKGGPYEPDPRDVSYIDAHSPELMRRLERNREKNRRYAARLEKEDEKNRRRTA